MIAPYPNPPPQGGGYAYTLRAKLLLFGQPPMRDVEWLRPMAEETVTPEL